jgi:hypothetical protein
MPPDEAPAARLVRSSWRPATFAWVTTKSGCARSRWARQDRTRAGLLAAVIAFGPFGLLQKGGEAYIHARTLGTAKTALEFKLPAVTAGTSAGAAIA